MKREDWRRAYEPLPESLASRVSHTLAHLEGEEQVKKLTLRTAVIVLAILLALCGMAYAIIESITADTFGWFYGEEHKQELLKGDIASVGQSWQLGEVVYTLEEMVYKTTGDFPGLYGVVRIRPADQSNVTLIAEDYSVNDAAGYLIYYGDEQIPEDAPSYAELAAQRGGAILMARAAVDGVSANGGQIAADIGESWMPQKDGSLMGIIEVSNGEMWRADSYEVSLTLSNWEVTPDGAHLREEPNSTLLRESRTIEVTPTIIGAAPDTEAAQEPAATSEPVAHAEEGALKVISSRVTAEEYAQMHPDRALEVIQVSFDENGVSNKNELLMSGDWDVAWADTGSISLKELYNAGLIMDLSGVESLTHYTKGLLPSIEKGLSVDGRLVALPVSVYGMCTQLEFVSTVQYSRDEQPVNVRAMLGFTDADEPHTFGELCGLAKRYMALDRAARKGTTFNYNSDSTNARAYFLSYLIDLYASEYCDESGLTDFDTPVFREALGQLNEMADALQADAKKSYGDNGRVYGVVNDVSSSLIGGSKLFLRVAEGNGIAADMSVIVINPKTTRMSEAIDYAVSMESFTADNAYMLYDSIDYEALRVRAYNKNIEAQKQEGEEQSVIDRLIELRDSGDTSYFVDKEDIELYKERVAPYLRFPLRPHANGYELASQYAQGALDDEGLISELNAAARLP